MDTSKLQYLKIPTPFSNFYVILRQTGSHRTGREPVVAAGFGSVSLVKQLLTGQDTQRGLTPFKGPHPYQEIVTKYFSQGTPIQNIIPLELSGTPFQQRVWRSLRLIPFGKTISYAGLAKKIGQPQAIRAVGSACKANRHLVFTPCHRVINTNGRLGNYRFGEKLKKQLLTHEYENLHTLR